MKKRVLTSAMVLLTVSGMALADRPFRDRAKVIDVEPIYRVVEVNQPEEQCWTEEVYHRNGGRRDSVTPAITGAIIGGAVGNRFGKGSGNKVMTIAGALLGASVGRDIGHRSKARDYVTDERRCEWVDRYREREELTGYRVKYRYKGRTFSTTTDEHPGQFIPVRVNVRPAFYDRYDD